ncbi:hypothetical protein Tco_0597588 [Tanacetum coccineum]
MNERACKLCVGAANEESLTSYNEIVVAIRGSVHELRHLELIGNKMSDIRLQCAHEIQSFSYHLQNPVGVLEVAAIPWHTGHASQIVDE